MDFTTTEAAGDLGGLARSIVDSVCTPDRQRELDALDERFDRELWAKLIAADVLSTTAPESLGGGGFGPLEETAVLVALGRQLAAVPYLESVVLAAGALATFGSKSLQQDWAAPAITGDKILTVALDGEMGQGPVQAQTVGQRPPPDRQPRAGALRTGRRRVPGARRDRRGHPRVPRRGRRRGRLGQLARHDRPRQRRPPRPAGRRGRRLPPRRGRRRRGVARPREAHWAAAPFSSACWSARSNSPRSTPGSASSSTGPSAASRPSASASPTATSTSRGSG